MRYILLVFIISMSMAGCAKAVEPTSPIASQRAPAGILPPDTHPISYQVNLKVDPRQTSFSGAVTMKVWLDEPSDGIWIHGDDLRVEQIAVEGKPATYEEVLPTGVSRITFDQTYPPDKSVLSSPTKLILT